MNSENRKRTILKAITYRGCGTLVTISIIYLFTGKLIASLGAGVVEVIAKMGFYYLHERAWAKIGWGKVKHPLADIPVKRELEPEDKAQVEQRLRELGYL
ncbi:MAG: DUF2061 domain-containing protein [bacterium]